MRALYCEELYNTVYQTNQTEAEHVCHRSKSTGEGLHRHYWCAFWSFVFPPTLTLSFWCYLIIPLPHTQSYKVNLEVHKHINIEDTQPFQAPLPSDWLHQGQSLFSGHWSGWKWFSPSSHPSEPKEKRQRQKIEEETFNQQYQVCCFTFKHILDVEAAD